MAPAGIVSEKWPRRPNLNKRRARIKRFIGAPRVDNAIHLYVIPATISLSLSLLLTFIRNCYRTKIRRRILWFNKSDEFQSYDRSPRVYLFLHPPR